ncbi:purine-nucleoside phosphorylase [Chitinophagaceae bacterium IBVUCB2]|nr:purine-nucleoside phosphorylase [Chitinophagaceae bacterium IBVUCB2]
MKLSHEIIAQTTSFLREYGVNEATVAIIMGTGLGEMVHKIDNPITIPFAKIPNFPEATVEFHKGNLVYGQIGELKVIALQGRFHYYEGYTMQQITFPIRVMKELGVRYLLLSNAAGAMNLSYKKGDLVLIEDHINLLPDNPLRGINDPALGQRFVDMSEPYDNVLIQQIEQNAVSQNVPLKKGIYIAVMGPNLETKAEYRWLRSMGADMVGMSTVPEVIVANQIGIKCAAVSVITDECDPNNLKPINIPEIIEVAGRSDKLLSNIFTALIKDME